MLTLNLKKILLLLSAAVSIASAYDHKPHHRYNFLYDTEKGYEVHRVISSTPIIKTVTKRVLIGDEIRDRVVQRRVPCRRGDVDENSIGLDTIIGAAAGVALGNQIGKGNGKTAAKVIGGLGGGMIANSMRGEKGDCYEEVTVQERIPRYETVTEERIVGYNNCVRVDGQKLCKESKNKLKFLKVKKTYSIY